MKSIEKTMKHDEKEKKQVNMMKREKTTMNNYENIGKKQWKMMKKRGTTNEKWWKRENKTMQNDEK